MKSFVKFAAVAVVAVASATSAVAAQTLPAASEIVAKHVAAIGGKDAIMKITSMQQKGTMEIPTMGLSATTEIFAAENKVAIKQSVPSIGDIEQGFDGTVGWSTNPMQGPRLLADKELEQIKEQSELQAGMLYSADRFTTMETVGLVDFNNEKAYKVRFVRKGSGRESIGYFSANSGLQIGAETTQESEMGKVSMTIAMSDYKQFGPLKMPAKTEMTMGANKIVTTTQEVTFNAVPATAFQLPPQVKALVKR
jgi:outer membrane lipoprotein-sorting protein